MMSGDNTHSHKDHLEEFQSILKSRNPDSIIEFWNSYGDDLYKNYICYLNVDQQTAFLSKVLTSCPAGKNAFVCSYIKKVTNVEVLKKCIFQMRNIDSTSEYSTNKRSVLLDRINELQQTDLTIDDLKALLLANQNSAAPTVSTPQPVTRRIGIDFTRVIIPIYNPPMPYSDEELDKLINDFDTGFTTPPEDWRSRKKARSPSQTGVVEAGMYARKMRKTDALDGQNKHSLPGEKVVLPQARQG